MKLIFKNLKRSSGFDNYQKRGRLNKNFIKAVTSNYSFKKCFTRRSNQEILKILLLVDISGSMRGCKLECAKVSMIILTEALEDLADIRIVLFTGNYDANNILVKDFGEPLDSRKVDLVGCHRHISSNLDGLTIEYEASKLYGNEIIIVISDGQPAGRGYGLREAMDQIQKVRSQFEVFAFSIDAEGEYLNKLYGKNNWTLAKSDRTTDLADKIMKFSRLVVNEFY
jgi:cobalamin biosynthesis protein CobT